MRLGVVHPQTDLGGDPAEVHELGVGVEDHLGFDKERLDARLGGRE